MTIFMLASRPPILPCGGAAGHTDRHAPDAKQQVAPYIRMQQSRWKGGDPMTEKALFGAGCFWGVEDFFRQVPGVTAAVSGYAGGTTSDPSYRQVCAGDTGHAEVVEVTFDPGQVSYESLVDLFFKMHNPTTRNRQGPDVGSQYRSVIFTHGPEQARIAAEVRDRVTASGRWKAPIVTEIEPAPPFWPAEDYHQRYHQKHGGSCHVSYAELAAGH
jgi:peptide-methionine (S)-S-oxide reductase